MKAEFSTEQNSVTIKHFDNKVYIYICLNGQKKERIEEEGNKTIFFEYDFKEIIEDENVLDLEDIKSNPNKYLNYKKKTLEDSLKEQREEIDLLNNCMLEMSMQLYK